MTNVIYHWLAVQLQLNYEHQVYNSNFIFKELNFIITTLIRKYFKHVDNL